MSISDTQIIESKRENEDLKNMVLELQNRLDSMEKKHQTFSQNLKTTLKKFDGVISDFRKEMNTTVSAIKSEFNAAIKRIDDLGKEREERMNSQSIRNFRIVAVELLNKHNKQSPSEAPNNAEDLRGESQ